uniref:Circadian associated repressor of transcription a n=1 Tax=Periophthalmus magnuspinnatus TaxID=409849 RepID=A0A3B3ZY90_9GOBI
MSRILKHRGAVCIWEANGGWRSNPRQRGGARAGTGGCGREREEERAREGEQERKRERDFYLVSCSQCAELQGFVRPLLELLNGLKKGRFDRGLSSFQQSVAMDRIQRIVGVLQRPNCGEKYLNTLLQVEVMLKLWFPQIATFPVSAASSVANSPALSLQDTAGFTPSHRHKDQSHIPGHSLEPSLTWVHIAPILSPRKSTSPKAAQSNNQSFAPPSSSRKRNSPATQDSSVSSTTTRKNQKSTTKTARCQSQPSAAQMNDNENDPSRSMSRHCPESVLSP